MILMGVLGVALVMGLALTVRWSGADYVGRTGGAAKLSAQAVGASYLRGVSVALVAGFWAGLLVTGPAVRLVMRLLAVTGGDAAQGRITEAGEVVGAIDLGGTVGLLLFGGLFPAMLSAGIYVVVRRWLPSGRWAGVAFGGLHLVVAATRLDPLRPDSPDFDLVGPGWLSVATFGLTAMAHGMAVVAFANRYSRAFLPESDRSLARRGIALPLVLPVLLALATVVAPMVIVAGLVVVVVVSRADVLVDAARSRTLVLCGRAALAGLALVMLPGAVTDLRDVAIRDNADSAAVQRRSAVEPSGARPPEVPSGAAADLPA